MRGRAFIRLTFNCNIPVVWDGPGGERDRSSRFFGPTLIRDVKPASELAKTEIFGPILNIMPFTNVDDVIDYINARPRPLALYCFAQDDAFIENVLAHTTSGGSCVNETCT